MKRYAWLTDIHLNFLSKDELEGFLATIRSESPDGVLISGDIGESHNLHRYLLELERAWEIPIWFVLGNHDFYRSSAAVVRQAVAELCKGSTYLHWLPAEGVVELGYGTGLVGHDGWADGRAGDYYNSDILLNDYWLIRELADLSPRERYSRLNAFGDEAAEHFRKVLPPALERFAHLYVLIHSPPFAEACWYMGKQSGPAWLPHLACQAAGEVLREAMQAHPDRQMTVLCGHTHGAGVAEILPNLTVITGGAQYKKPALQRIIDVPSGP
jgi:predicted phosphodiesterase